VRHLLILTALVLLAAAVQAVVVARSVVPALDSGRFLITSQWMDHEGLLTAVRNQPEQPLYSMWVWTVRRAIGATAGEFPSQGAVTVQLAAAIPLVLIVVPVYFLAFRVYGPRAAIAGTSLFCLLPEVARLGPDGISDSLHLLLLAIGLCAVVVFLTGPAGRGAMAGFGHPAPDDRPWQPGHPGWLLLAGVATGLAALVRIEAFVLPLVLAVGAVTLLFFRAGRHAWRPLLVAGAGYSTGLLLILAPFLTATGATTPRAAWSRLIARPGPERFSVPTPGALSPKPQWHFSDGGAMSFAPKEATSSRHRGLGGALRSYGRELCEAFWYWVGLLGVLALLIARRLAAKPVDWFLRMFFVTFSMGVLAFGAREGYLSARHLLPLVIVGVGCCGFGAVEIGAWLARQTAIKAIPEMAPLSIAAVVALAGAACLGQTLLPVGRAALAHREAGGWLAAQQDSGTVIDTRGWSRLYSGRKTYQYADGAVAFADPNVGYVVVEPWELQGDSPRSRTLRQLLESAGERAAEFAGFGDELRRAVAVYRWRPERICPGATTRVAQAQRVHDARTSASLCPERRGGF
jgi:hypothetical protein